MVRGAEDEADQNKSADQKSISWFGSRDGAQQHSNMNKTKSHWTGNSLGLLVYTTNRSSITLVNERKAWWAADSLEWTVMKALRLQAAGRLP